MCCHEFLARLLLGKDHGQGKAVSFARVYEQAAEGPCGPQTADDWYTAWAEQVWQDRGADQHDSGAVQGLLRKNLHLLVVSFVLLCLVMFCPLSFLKYDSLGGIEWNLLSTEWVAVKGFF